MKALIKIRDAIRWCIRTLSIDLLEDFSRIQQYNLSTARIHGEVFPQFKNKHCGQDIAIIACGPSLNDYTPIPGAISIGVNRAINCDKVKLDYLFTHDLTPGTIQSFNNYRGNNCIKFYGLAGGFLKGPNWSPSESDTIKAHAFRYRTDNLVDLRIENNSHFAYDLSVQPFGDFGSVVFVAIQFALWTNPKRIYLVGCDCTNSGHFDKSSNSLPIEKIKHGYYELKKFASIYYPETEIISVNPVGLKGLFKDWVQSDRKLCCS